MKMKLLDSVEWRPKRIRTRHSQSIAIPETGTACPIETTSALCLLGPWPVTNSGPETKKRHFPYTYRLKRQITVTNGLAVAPSITLGPKVCLVPCIVQQREKLLQRTKPAAACKEEDERVDVASGGIAHYLTPSWSTGQARLVLVLRTVMLESATTKMANVVTTHMTHAARD